MRSLQLLCAAALTVAAIGEDKPAGGERKDAAADSAKSVLDFTMKNIDGKDVALSTYKGDVVLIVNVASKCGLTPQYRELQALYEKYKDKGFRIAAFPANNFGNQEPGTDGEIRQFCAQEYKVTFDLYSKISVKGEDQAELYRFLTSKERNPEFGGEIKWNFTKFLIGRDGKVIGRFEPKEKPGDEKVVKAIEAALAAARPPSAEQKP